MGYRVEQIAENTILITILPPFQPTVDLPALHLSTAALCATMRSPITRVVDLSRIEIPFSEWATTLYEATRKRAGSMSDLRFHSIFVLGNNDSTWALGQNLSREEYGDLRFELVTTLEEALERVGAV